ncbi:hypothetical protein KFL_001270140 [Klebsormidium nitens]|uniref:Uncharacterized protein n=1 Tax=Klebsormidium nitens TaxID=105231 RepID=A0A1Y1I124_KLENI|nr:hypothetical protein KFL_001270140 [Klebsormidium nitens]|eukprot:GAQ82871.1 hypothetical protein KFL_001270140 [Klebsormidium nitens]
MAAKVVPGDGMDTDYLKSTIGNALSEGCAATALAHPPDPVDFLSSWLVQYARNKSIRAGMAEEKREELERERLANERAEAEEREKKDKEMWREMGLERVAGFSDDAWLMWTRALEEARKHTGISAAYVAVLEEGSPAPEPTEDGEEPEEPPEEEEAEEEQPEEDGPDAWYNVPEENPNPEKPSTEPGEEEPGEEEKAEEKEEGEEEEEKPTGPDYTSTQLWYTVVNGGDERAILGKKLTRAQGGVSFEVLDQNLPTLHVPNVLYKRGVHFFGGMPRLGALFVAAIPPSAADKPVQALLCADTLRTDLGGSGRPLSAEDQAFLTALAAAMARATVEGEAKSAEVAENVKAQVDILKAALYRVQEEQKAAAAAAEEEGEKEEPEEEAEEGAEAPAAAAPASTPLTRAALALSQTRAAYAAAVAALDAVRADEVARLKRAAKCSPMMLRVLHAAAAALGRDATALWPDWSRAREDVNADFVKTCQEHDPAGSAANWSAIRRLLKDIDGKALLAESPLAYVLYRWILSCKFVEVAHRAHVTAQEEADAAAAEKAREEAEAAAVAAAEAAEAKEEGDEDEEGEEDDEVDELANMGDSDENPGRMRSPTVL